MRTIAVGRKNLFSDRRRAALGITGVATSLLLALALDGIFAGAMRGVTRYIDTSAADVFVAQRGVRNMHMTSSSVPLPALDEIRSMRGVRWTDAIRYVSDSLEVGSRRQLAYVIGYRPGGRGGPTSIVEGVAPGPGEIIIDQRGAEILDVGVGDELEVLGRGWRISGLAPAMTSIVNSLAFVTFEDLAAARGLEGTASYLLVGTDPDDEQGVIADIEANTGLTAQTREAFSEEEAQAIRDMSTELIAIMRFAAFVIALVVVGLTLYAATISRIHEVGVMKALGATPGRVWSSVIDQAAWSVGAAAAIAVVAALTLAWVLGLLGAVPMTVEPGSVLRIAVGAFALGLFGAVVPIIRVSRVDPASVYRR